MQRDRLPYLLIPLAACIAILPLVLHGCSCGHDFDFHLLNWMEAARQFTHGNLHPHWAYTAAWNAGEPRFVFYPPLSWTLGAILTLLFPVNATPIVYTWLALTAGGLALHLLARAFAPPTAALLAAILYTVNPYMLFTAYERTAYAELLAAAFIPLLLHAILRERVTVPRIAIPIALLWLTNAPAAVMSCYALALLTLVRLVIERKPRSNHFSKTTRNLEPEESSTPVCPRGDASQTPFSLAFNTICGTALGLTLAAFYLIPAAYERRYVQIAMAVIPNMRIQDNFLFHHTGDALHDQVLHTASILALILLAATLTALVLARRRSGKPKLHPPSSPASPRPYHPEQQTPSPPSRQLSSRPERSELDSLLHFVRVGKTLLVPLAILTLTIILLLTPLTVILWNHAPELAFLQFPWRLLAILAAVMSLAFALAITGANLSHTATTALTIALAAALTYPAYTVFHQVCDQEDTPTAREALFHSSHGTDPTDEYTPTNADNDSLAQNDPAYWLSPDPNAKAPTQSQPAPAPKYLTLNPPVPEDLILNLRDYPAWHITNNGSLITTRDQRDDGLIAFPIPAGQSLIVITYAKAFDQTLGDAISLIALTALLLLLFRKPKSVSVLL